MKKTHASSRNMSEVTPAKFHADMEKLCLELGIPMVEWDDKEDKSTEVYIPIGESTRIKTTNQ